VRKKISIPRFLKVVCSCYSRDSHRFEALLSAKTDAVKCKVNKLIQTHIVCSLICEWYQKFITPGTPKKNDISSENFFLVCPFLPFHTPALLVSCPAS